MSKTTSKDCAQPNTVKTAPTDAEVTKLDRRGYLKAAAAGLAGGAALSMPSIVKADSDRVWDLKLQSNWTGIGIQSQDRAAKLFVERVNRMSNGRIRMRNFDAEVLLGIGETFRGVGSGVADLAVTASVYHRGIVPAGEFLWSVPFFPVTNLEFYEYIYQFMGVKELWREAYAEHGVMHLTYELSDEWGSMVSTRPIEKFSDYEGMKVRAFGIWADWLVHNGASIAVVPGGEVYTAVQTRILDAAAFGAPDAWAGLKMYEVCDYFVNPSVAPYDVCEIIMNLDTFNEMPEDLQEVMLSASRVHNLDIAALTIPTDAAGRKALADGGMQTMLMPEDELKKASDWCWDRFVSKKGQDPYIDRMIDIYAEARELYKNYYGPKKLPV